jgi:hypothetical protein
LPFFARHICQDSQSGGRQGCPEEEEVITDNDLGKVVKYWRDRWHTGTLVTFEKQGKKIVAVISTPIAGQRRKRVPVEDVEIYGTETVQKGTK